MKCPFDLCDGSGFVIAERDDSADEASPCRCRVERRHRQRVRRAMSALPESLQHVGFDRWPITNMPSEQVDPAREYAQYLVDEVGPMLERQRAELALATHSLDRERIEREIAERTSRTRGLWLEGPSGTGKSTLAAAVAIRAGAGAGMTVAFWNFSRLLMKIRMTSFSADSEASDVEWLDWLAEVDLLILDDLGAEKRSDWATDFATNIVGRREECRRPVIATTNLVRDELREHLGPRVVSRLHAVAGSPISCQDHDWRQIVADAEAAGVEPARPAEGAPV